MSYAHSPDLLNPFGSQGPPQSLDWKYGTSFAEAVVSDCTSRSVENDTQGATPTDRWASYAPTSPALITHHMLCTPCRACCEKKQKSQRLLGLIHSNLSFQWKLQELPKFLPPDCQRWMNNWRILHPGMTFRIHQRDITFMQFIQPAPGACLQHDVCPSYAPTTPAPHTIWLHNVGHCENMQKSQRLLGLEDANFSFQKSAIVAHVLTTWLSALNDHRRILCIIRHAYCLMCQIGIANKALYKWMYSLVFDS